MTTRVASCTCGQLRLTCEGEPVRVSICHCLACQQRTGSPFGYQARFSRAGLKAIEGRSTAYTRIADSGNTATFHFCPVCGVTVYYEPNTMPEFFAVPVGVFMDPSFPPPKVSVYESRKHAWVNLSAMDIEHD